MRKSNHWVEDRKREFFLYKLVHVVKAFVSPDTKFTLYLAQYVMKCTTGKKVTIPKQKLGYKVI
jgi:hypothetical protein